MMNSEIRLSVEELEAIREEARAEGKLEGKRELPPPPPPQIREVVREVSVGFSADEMTAVREELEERVRVLESELKAARHEIEELRASEPELKKVTDEILRLAYNLDQAIGGQANTRRLRAVPRR